MTLRPLAALAAAATIAALPAGVAQAGRASRIDGSLQVCSVTSALGGNGSIEVDVAAYLETPENFGTICDSVNYDFANPLRIPMNFYGTTYERLFINENGTLTFGAGSAATATPDLLNFGTPVIAPLLADVDLLVDGSVSYGWNSFSRQFVVTFASVQPSSGGASNYMQVIISDDSALTGTEGDFTLELNYDRIAWDLGGATAGFSNGAGLGFVFAGAGEAGAYLGSFPDFDVPNCDASNPLACRNFNVASGTTNQAGFPVTGRYRFEFRNGVPVAVPGDDIDVPAPAGLGLVALGSLLLMLRRQRQL